MKRDDFNKIQQELVNKWYRGSDAEFCYNVFGNASPIVIKDIHSDGTIVVSNQQKTAILRE